MTTDSRSRIENVVRLETARENNGLEKSGVPQIEQGVLNPRNKRPKKPREKVSRVVVDMHERESGAYLGYFVDSLGHKPGRRDFVRLFKGLAKLIAENPRWPSDTRIFMLMLWQLEYGNFLAVTRAEIAKFLGVARNTVGRVVGMMLEDGIIQADTYKGADGFRLNPNYIHMGTDAQRAARRQEWARMLEAKAVEDAAKKRSGRSASEAHA